MKRIITSIILSTIFYSYVSAEEFVLNSQPKLKVVIKETVVDPLSIKEVIGVTQDTARIGIPIYYYFADNHKYQSKAIHYTVTDNLIRFSQKYLTKHIPILKNHPNIVAVSIGGGYFLIWDILIEKQADMPALIADSLAVLTNLKLKEKK